MLVESDWLVLMFDQGLRVVELRLLQEFELS